MIVISNSMPKSGSTLVMNWTVDLFKISNKESESQKKLQELTRKGGIPGLGDFVQYFNDDIIYKLVDLEKEYGDLVVKMHIQDNYQLNEILKNGNFFSTFTYRDLRDFIMSAIDHKNRTHNTDNPVFSHFTDTSVMVKEAEKWGNISIANIKNSSVCSLKYEQTILDSFKAIKKVNSYLGNVVDDNRLKEIIEKEIISRSKGKSQFNTGLTERYLTEMDSDLKEYLTYHLKDVIQGMGY